MKVSRRPMLLLLPPFSAVGTALAVYLAAGLSDALIAGALMLSLMASLSILLYLASIRETTARLLDNPTRTKRAALALALGGFALVATRAVVAPSDTSVAALVFAGIALIGAATVAMRRGNGTSQE